MFIVIVRYTAPLSDIDRALDGHRRWVAQGYEDGVFLLSGPQAPRNGGAILAHNLERAALEARVAQYPFHLAGVATHEIIEVQPNTADDRLAFLLAR